jgi:hypothetical protein
MSNIKQYLALLLLFLSFRGQAQSGTPNLVLDMSGVDGIDLVPANIFNYRIDNRSQQAQQVTVRGRLQFRRSQLGFSYSYTALLQPGSNNMSSLARNPSWTYTDPALRELFQTYSKLPQGTYEYCVSVVQSRGGESTGTDQPDACVYNTVDDIFLISLMAPENDAKLHEYNPMLSWTVNYRFASELTYRLRVAELKKGQTPIAAITRNNPVYQDAHVPVTAAVYPVTARPLEKGQPYVWTVDAYYKGILLGGAETWKFTIIDDTLFTPDSSNQSYYDFAQHIGETQLSAIGELKLKYNSDLRSDTLHLQVFDADNKEIKQGRTLLALQPGNNQVIFRIFERFDLRHKGNYQLQIRTSDNRQFTVPFRYINPLLSKQ